MEQGAPVHLAIYDLSGGLARQWAPMLLGRSLEAIYHTALVVNGREIYYGGGINVAPAGATPFGRPMEVLELGRTFLDEEILDALLVELSERYTPQAYRLLSNNCNTFSDELATMLVGKGIPSHITGLPDEVMATPFGQMIRPLLYGLEQQLASMRTQAFHPLAGAAAAPEPEPAVLQGAGGAPGAPPPGPAPPPAEAAAPAAAPAPAYSRLAAAALAEGAPALAAAEVEIEAAIAGGMVQDAEQRLQRQHGDGNGGGSAGTSAAGAPAAAPGQGAGGDGDRLATELEVKAAFERLSSGGGLSEHDALAAALEAVSPRQAPEDGAARQEPQ